MFGKPKSLEVEGIEGECSGNPNHSKSKGKGECLGNPNHSKSKGKGECLGNPNHSKMVVVELESRKVQVHNDQ